MSSALLTVERLKELLDYNPATGVFTRLQVRCHPRLVGEPAGCLDNKGYLRIRVDRKKYRAHRLAWFYMTGGWPKEQVDHIDCDRSNNKWSNLREATGAENSRNYRRPRSNTSGYKGVSWNTAVKKWVAHVCVDRKKIYLGCFDDPAVAHAAYAEAAGRLHGEFARAA